MDSSVTTFIGHCPFVLSFKRANVHKSMDRHVVTFPHCATVRDNLETILLYVDSVILFAHQRMQCVYLYCVNVQIVQFFNVPESLPRYPRSFHFT
jgi:hypothetical protein